MTRFADGASEPPPIEELTLLQRLRIIVFGVPLPRPINVELPSDRGLRFETVEIPGPVGRLEAWFVPGSGPRQGLVLLFHGYGVSKTSLLNAAERFHRWGWDALLVDLRGAGNSTGQWTSLGYLEGEDVLAASAFAQARWKGPYLFYGVSMGSVAVLRAFGSKGLPALGAILESPFDTLLNAIRNRFRLMRIPSFPSAEFMLFWGGRRLGFNGFSFRAIDDARKVDCPVLVLHGEKDGRVTEKQAEGLVRALGGPKRYHVFKDLGHDSFVKERPEEWDAQVRPFLDSLSPRP